MTQAGERAATSAGKVTKATDEEKQSLSELLDHRIDPVNAALNKLDKQQQDLARIQIQGDGRYRYIRSLFKENRGNTKQANRISR